MGFRLPEKTALLRFEGDFAGAEVRVIIGGVPLGDFFAVIDQYGENWPAGVRTFADRYLVSWNLEHGRMAGPELEGQPIPATGDGMQACDRDFAQFLFTEWIKAVRNPPVPFDASAPEAEPEPVATA